MAKIKEEKIIVKFSVLLGDNETFDDLLVDNLIKEEITQLAQNIVEEKLAQQNSNIRLLVETTLENTTTIVNS